MYLRQFICYFVKGFHFLHVCEEYRKLMLQNCNMQNAWICMIARVLSAKREAFLHLFLFPLQSTSHSFLNGLFFEMGAFISFMHKADWNVEYSIIDKNRDETKGEGAKEIYQILLAIVLSPSVMSLPQPHIMHGIPSLLELYNCCNANRHLNKYLWLALKVQCIWLNACLKNYSRVTFMCPQNLSTHFFT